MNPHISELHIKIGMKLDYYAHFEYNDVQLESLKAHLGITKGGWKALLAGKREITLSELLKLSNWFNTSLNNIVAANF